MRYFDFYFFLSYDDVFYFLGENVNISDLEVFKDEFSFDRDFMVDGDEDELVSSRFYFSFFKFGDRSF